LIAVLISVICLLCVLVIYSLINRIPHWSAETVTLSSINVGGTVVKKEEALIKFNRGGTGIAYLYKNGSWTLIKESTPIATTKMELSDTVGITGKGGFDSNGFTVSIYNGTKWRLTALKIDVSVKCTDKSNSFERNYYEKTDIAPFSEGAVIFNITKPTDYDSFTWGIIGDYGFPELVEDKSN